MRQPLFLQNPTRCMVEILLERVDRMVFRLALPSLFHTPRGFKMSFWRRPFELPVFNRLLLASVFAGFICVATESFAQQTEGFVPQAAPSVTIEDSDASNTQRVEIKAEARYLEREWQRVQASPSPARDPDGERLFRDALDGKPVNTSDPMMADALRVLLQRGSILKGSSLESETATDPSSSLPAVEEWKPEQSFLSHSKKSLGDPANQQQSLENRLFAVELLLRTARKLSKIAGDDPALQKLVNQMRRQAVIMGNQTDTEKSSLQGDH